MDLMQEYEHNPFMVLDAMPCDSREQLISRQADLALFDDEHVTEKALAQLLHAQNRLSAEMRWFPQTSREELRRFRDFLTGADELAAIPDLNTPSVLARFNALRLCVGRFKPMLNNEFEALVYALATLADALSPAQVMDELNVDRRAAGFAELDMASDVMNELRALFDETLQALFDSFRGHWSPKEVLRQRLERAYKKPDSRWHNSFFVERAAVIIMQQ